MRGVRPDGWYGATVRLGGWRSRAIGLRRARSRGSTTCPRTGPVIVAATHVAYPDFMTLADAGRRRGRSSGS